MNIRFRNTALSAAVLLVAASPMSAGVKTAGSNTYTIDTGGRLTFTLPTNIAAPCTLTNYHPNSDSKGFGVVGGAIETTAGHGEIQANGAATFCAPNGDTLELRRWQMENFGDVAFVTAEVVYTPAWGSASGIPQHDGRLPVFQVVRSKLDQVPTAEAASGNVIQEFSFWMNPAFQINFPEFFPTPVKSADTYGTLLYQFGVEQEEAPEVPKL